MAAAAGGLDVAQFLKHSAEGGSSGQWLKQWKKDQVGEITIWLHTRAPIVPCFSHSFMLEDEYENKDTGRMEPVLRYPRFISPDAEVVHRSQYFRNDDGSLQVPPDRDAFLLLREWLRNAEHIGLEQPVFKWTDEKKRQVHVWERGELSGLVKRGQLNFNHSLDTKQEYIYVVVDNDNVATGPVLAREGKLLSQKMVEVISYMRKQYGEEEGDPLRHPYAFIWVAEKASSPMNKYKVHKAERAVFTDEVWDQIGSQEFPDPLPYGKPADGDPEKLRDAMAAAMQVDLPLDALFSEDQEERRSLLRGPTRSAPRASKASQARGTAQQPPPPTRSAKPGAVGQAQQKASTTTNAATPPAAAAPQQRRKKVDKPADPPPPPQAETLPCEDCGALMFATDTKCGACGAEYEVEEAPEEAPPPPAPKPATTAGPKPGAGASASAKSSGAKPSTAGPKPGAAAKQQELPATDAPAERDETTCWSCSSDLQGKPVCPSCGIDQGDDIPF